MFEGGARVMMVAVCPILGMEANLGSATKRLEHRAQNLKQIFAARMLYFKVLDRRAS
jgi:hypothetical protein